MQGYARLSDSNPVRSRALRLLAAEKTGAPHLAISRATVFMGMEEIGAQVEQPFESMPLWQLCHTMAHDAEAAIAGDAPGHVEGTF